MTNRIQMRRGTAAEWTAANPVLSDGEVGFDRTNNQVRIGDGVTVWLSLTAIGATNIEAIQDAIGATWVDSSTVDVAYNDAAGTLTASAVTQQSVTADSSGIRLVGDQSSPGGSAYYGTSPGGTKGWWPVSTVAAPWDSTGHATGTAELYWDEAAGAVKLRAPSPAVSLARKIDIRAPAYGGRVDGRVVPGATCSSGGLTVTFAAAHGIVAGDVGKTGWITNVGGVGTVRTIASVDSTTQITLSGTTGRTVSSGGQFIYGTPINTAAQAALTAAGAMTTVDATAGTNLAWGPVSGVEVYVGGGTGIAILTAQLTVPRGVRWNSDGIIYCGGLTATPYWSLASNTSIGRLTADVGSGNGLIWGDTTSDQAHCSWERIEFWARGSTSTNHLITLQGLDYQGGEIWTKGGATAVRCLSGTDSNLGHIFAIGPMTAIAISNGSQITGKIFCDTAQAGIRMWGGCDNVHLDIQAFLNSASTSGTTPLVIFGTKDDGTTNTTLNQDIRLQVQARETGAPVLNLNYCQNVNVRGFVSADKSGGALVPSTRPQVTGVAYGTSVGDGIDIELGFPSLTQLLSDGTTPAYRLYTGTPVGRYVAIFDNKQVWVTGSPEKLVGGTTTAPLSSPYVTDLDIEELLHLLSTGQATLPGARALNSSNTISMSSGTSRLTYFVARRTEPITQLKLFSGSTASASATLIRSALHSVASTGDTTVLASTVNDTALFAATNTAYTRALSATVNLVRGARYAFELLIVGGTPGSFPGVSAFSGPTGSSGLAAHLADAPRVFAAVNGQTDIGTGYTAAAIAAASNAGTTSSGIYAVLLP